MVVVNNAFIKNDEDLNDVQSQIRLTKTKRLHGFINYHKRTIMI